MDGKLARVRVRNVSMSLFLYAADSVSWWVLPLPPGIARGLAGNLSEGKGRWLEHDPDLRFLGLPPRFVLLLKTNQFFNVCIFVALVSS